VDQSSVQRIVTDLEFSKETKRTEVFSTEDAGAAVNQLYVDKVAIAQLGNPKAIRITIEAVE